MAYWVRDSSLRIGLDIIDEQHKRIIDYINDLDKILTSKNFDKLKDLIN